MALFPFVISVMAAAITILQSVQNQPTEYRNLVSKHWKVPGKISTRRLAIQANAVCGFLSASW